MAKPSEYHPLKGKKRHLSWFLVEEMMYDYVIGQLDSGRRKALSEYLETSKEARDLERRLKDAIEYCNSLSQTEVSEPLMEKLVKSKSLWNRWVGFIAWKQWPEATRWTLEAFAVSLVVAFIVAVSWPKISNWFPERQSDVVLAELDKKKAEVVEPIVATPEKKSSEVESQSAAITLLQVAENSQPKSTLSIEEETPVVGQQDDVVEAAAEEVTVVKPAVEKPKPKGFVYRAFMTLGKIEEVTEEIRLKLQTLGGQKAGEVRMGWRKPKGSYFHFSIPESNYDTVVEMLRSFGPVQIAKDPHWRVMPEGKIRIILWVEDMDLKKQNL